MAVSTEAIRKLRERTGAGIMDVKRALEAADGDIEKAEAGLREKGIAKAASKTDRATSEGVVDSYIHAGNRVGTLVELNCETDFVGRMPEFVELAHNIAMQVAAMNPVYITREEIPEGEDRKPEEICLMDQAFIKDTSKSIADMVLQVQARVGENVRVSRFIRFGLGE
ncbi:MAG: elongation factor Ts [Chloroflexi bacterium]|nr:elongation factor Ts [Chloroflexota bacterium]